MITKDFDGSVMQHKNCTEIMEEHDVDFYNTRSAVNGFILIVWYIDRSDSERFELSKEPFDTGEILNLIARDELNTEYKFLEYVLPICDKILQERDNG